MGDEAYRAVFLRVHPTGKMVLSLTTESDGQGGAVRAARRRRARRSRARREGRAGGHEPIRRRPRLQHDPVRRAPRRRSPAPPRRSAPRRSCSQAWRWTPPPETLSGRTERGSAPTAAIPTQVKTIEDLALYAHGTGALPPGSRRRPGRADGLQPTVSARGAGCRRRVARRSTSSATFSAPNSAE